MNWLQKFDKSFEEVILGVLLVGMSIILMLQILMRAIVGHSLTWAEELARYFYVWSVFLSIGCTIRVGNILRVDLLLNMLPQGLRKIMEILLDVLSVVLYSFLAYASISVVQKVQTGGQTSPAMEVPMYLVYLIVPVGFALASLRSVQKIYFTITNKKVDTEKNPAESA